MTLIHHEIEAACPPERVWAVLADLEAVQHYNPTVRIPAVKGSRRTGVGADRVCELMPKGRVVELVPGFTSQCVVTRQAPTSLFDRRHRMAKARVPTSEHPTVR
jgi:hypothetical protein